MVECCRLLPVVSRLSELVVIQDLLTKPRNILHCALQELPTMSMVMKRYIIVVVTEVTVYLAVITAL
jgi:hypothetical protein